MQPAFRALILLVAAVTVATIAVADSGPHAAAQTDPIVSVDSIPDADNTGTSVGQIDACRSVSSDTSFDIDIVIQQEETQEIGGFQADLLYDGAVLNVIDVNYNFLLASTNQTVWELGESPPDSDGAFLLAAATRIDSADGTYVSGSGVLARVRLKSVGVGTSVLDLTDVKLSDPTGNPIPPSDPDTGVYLGPVNDGLVAVDQTDTDGDGVTDPCDPDDDNDGWTDEAEAFIGTDPFLACGSDAWPPDIDSNGSVQIDDVSFVAGKFGTSSDDSGYTPRAELASQNGTIQIDDVAVVSGRFGKSC